MIARLRAARVEAVRSTDSTAPAARSPGVRGGASDPQAAAAAGLQGVPAHRVQEADGAGPGAAGAGAGRRRWRIEPGETTFYFMTRKGKLRRLELTPAQAKQLEDGALGVVERPEPAQIEHSLVPAATAEQMFALSKKSVRFLNRKENPDRLHERRRREDAAGGRGRGHGAGASGRARGGREPRRGSCARRRRLHARGGAPSLRRSRP